MATHFTGKVQRLYVTADQTYVRLGIPASEQPLESYFTLQQSHVNYNALYSLALSAAINGYNLTIRTAGDVSPGEEARVRYMVVNW